MDKEPKSQNKNPNWLKKYIIIYSLIGFLLLILSYLFFGHTVESFAFIIFALLFIFIAFLYYVIRDFTVAKLGHAVNTPLNKFSEKVLGIGKAEKTGQVLFSWTISQGEAAWITMLKFYKALLGFCFFMMLFSFVFFRVGDNPLPILESVLGSIVVSSVLIFVFLFMILAMKYLTPSSINYEITTDGVYFGSSHLSETYKGLFIPFSDLNNPRFDEKHKTIDFKYKGKFLRTFIHCTPENYKEISDFIKKIFANHKP